MASGHANRANRPNTWLHRPSCKRAENPCQRGAVHTWHICDKPPRRAWVRFWVLSGHLFARQPLRSLTLCGPFARLRGRLKSDARLNSGGCATRHLAPVRQRFSSTKGALDRIWLLTAHSAHRNTSPSPPQTYKRSVSHSSSTGGSARSNFCTQQPAILANPGNKKQNTPQKYAQAVVMYDL
jgi:hypothetical protein